MNGNTNKHKQYTLTEDRKLIHCVEVQGMSQREAAKACAVNGRTISSGMNRIGKMRANGRWQVQLEYIKSHNWEPQAKRGRPSKPAEVQLELPLETPQPSEPEPVVESSRYWLYVKAVSAFSAGALLGMAIGHNFL